MVGIHAVLRLCLSAPVAMVHCLAPTTCTGYYLSTPCLELRRAVDRIDLPWWQLGGAGVEGADQRGESAKFGHDHAFIALPCGRPARLHRLDPEHLGHDPLELDLDELGQHLLCEYLPEAGVEDGGTDIACALALGVGALDVPVGEIENAALR